MGRPGSNRGRRAGGGGRGGKPSQPRQQPDRRGSTAEPSGPARLLLTRLVREGTIWNVYIATSGEGGDNRTHLQFEGAGAAAVRHSRRADEQLLAALYSGAPVSRAKLQEELELALADAEGVGRAQSDPAAPTDS